MAQKNCPSCNGRKYVWKPKLVWDSVNKKWVDNGTQVPCSECGGRGTIPA